MTNSSAVKKRIVTNFKNLSADLQAQIKSKYPLGFSDYMMRIDKPDGTFFYAVSYDTDDVSYLVKIDVKVDNKANEEDYKYDYEDVTKESDDSSNNDNDNDDDM